MLRTFHRWGGLVFIVYVFPNWMRDFLFLSLSDLIRDIDGGVYCELSCFPC